MHRLGWVQLQSELTEYTMTTFARWARSFKERIVTCQLPKMPGMKRFELFSR